MKLLATDYDGTLSIHQEVSERNRKYIKDFQADGNKFGIVTGRSTESILKEIDKYKLDVDFLVANNGGVVYDKNMNLLKCTYMDFDGALSIIEYIRTCKCAAYVINDGYYRAKVVVNPELEDKKYGGTHEFKSSEEILNAGKIAQLVISLTDPVVAREIQEHINTRFGHIAVAYTNVNCVDIAPLNVSKAQGLRLAASNLGIDESDIYTIGDSYNDLPMLKAFHGACVENSNEEIKKEIKEVYKDVASYLEAIK